MTNTTQNAENAQVLWIIPTAWEDEGRVMAQHAPIPLVQWLQIIRDEKMTVLRLPESQITDGPCDRGQVLRVDSDDDTNYFALPPEAIPSLEGLLAAEDYRILARQSAARRTW